MDVVKKLCEDFFLPWFFNFSCLQKSLSLLIFLPKEISCFTNDIKIELLRKLSNRIQKGICFYYIIHTYLLLEQNIWHATVKGVNVYFSSQFVQVLVTSWLAPREDSMAERHGQRRNRSWQEARKKQQQWDFLSLFIPLGHKLIGWYHSQSGWIFRKFFQTYPELLS